MSSVPKLRFAEFDGEWNILTLSDVVDDKRRITYGIVQPGEFVDKGVPLVRGGDYARGWVDLSSIKRVAEEIDRPYKRSKLKTDDLLLTIVGANTGTVARVPNWLEGANITQTTARVAVDDSKAESNFIEQYLKSSLGAAQVYKFIKGAAQPGLNLSDVGKFTLLTPRQKSEQQKIGSFLSSVDKKIDLLRQKKDALELCKKGLMQKIFSQEIRFKQDDGSDFPVWEGVALGDVFTERSERGHGDKQLLGVTLSKGVVRASEIKKIDRSSSDLSSYKCVMVGDIAYNSMRMWQGASGDSNYNGIVSPAYTVITPLGDNETKFWAYLFRYPEMIKVFERHSQGLTSDTWNLKFKALSTIKVLRPSGKEQKKISSYFTSIDAKVEKLSSQIEQMETFKKGLLQQMFV